MSLDKLRKAIDTIDDQLITLLNQRMEIVKQVGDFKRTQHAIIYRPEREKSIVDRLDTLSKGKLLNKKAIESIFLEVFAVSRNLELPERVSYWGTEGSFTHQAAESRFGAMSECIPLKSIQSVFESVSKERVRFGVVPIENSQDGTIHETVDMLCNYEIKIVAEIPMPIRFALATKEEKLHQIKRVYSKARSFRQCRRFIEEYLHQDVQTIEVDSMPAGTQRASQECGTAAICSDIAAKIHKLPILFENIEDSAFNQTRFLIISKNIINQKSVLDKTSILVKITDKAGSLVSFLQEFKDKGINLTKIESRPAMIDHQFKYWFLIDFEGYFQDQRVRYVLDKYENIITFMGSYVKLT